MSFHNQPPEGIKRKKGYRRADQSFSLVTTSAVANQSVGTYAPPVGKHFKLQVIIIEVYYTTLAAAALYLGTIEVRWGTDRILGLLMATNTTSAALFGLVVPIPYPSFDCLGDGATTLNVRCNPTVVTSITWKVNLIGYYEGS